jgi:release factor glutamine methyltransferase
VDQSADALALAAENTTLLGFTDRVQLLASNWFSAVPNGRKFQLIVTNPPYLSEAEVAEAQPEVKDHEPKAALTPGGDGTASLREILAEAPRYLEAGGLLACETGVAQHKQLLEVAAAAGYARTKSLPDLTGRERYLLAFV